MLLIFGLTPRKKIGEKIVRYSCPHCNDIRNFQEVRVRQFISFFFIPVIPVSKQTYLYSCPTCGYTITSEQAYSTPEPSPQSDEPNCANKVLVFCPRCEGPMFLPLQETRQNVICPHCTMEFKVRGINGDIPTALSPESTS